MAPESVFGYAVDWIQNVRKSSSANLLQRVLRAVFQTKAHFDNPFFPPPFCPTSTESAQHVLGPFLQINVDDRLGGRGRGAVFDV